MVTSITLSNPSKVISLEEWMENPPVGTEWVDGELLEKNGMTLKHSEFRSISPFTGEVIKLQRTRRRSIY
jgi:hypothetical protein